MTSESKRMHTEMLAVQYGTSLLGPECLHSPGEHKLRTPRRDIPTNGTVVYSDHTRGGLLVDAEARRRNADV
jgi:hypothetical protein